VPLGPGSLTSLLITCLEELKNHVFTASMLYLKLMSHPKQTRTQVYGNFSTRKGRSIHLSKLDALPKMPTTRIAYIDVILGAI
jgi:hypothetical protein